MTDQDGAERVPLRVLATALAAFTGAYAVGIVMIYLPGRLLTGPGVPDFARADLIGALAEGQVFLTAVYVLGVAVLIAASISPRCRRALRRVLADLGVRPR